MDERSIGSAPITDLSDAPPDLQPSKEIFARLRNGREIQQRGDTRRAAHIYASAATLARQMRDGPGEARSLAQLAALEESCGEIESGLVHNRQAIECFLKLGDGTGLVQAYRLNGFLYLRQGDVEAASTAFAQALALALQLETRLVMVTLNQILPAARYLIESGQLPALLPLGASMLQAVDRVEQERGSWPQEMADVAEIIRTAGGIFPPLALMATEPDLSQEKRRSLAARATHQAWMVDAFTRRRWNLSDLVDETLKGRLGFHEKLD